MKALTALKRFMRDERGVTAIEYGLIASVIALAVAVAAEAVAGQISTVFNSIVTALGG